MTMKSALLAAAALSLAAAAASAQTPDGLKLVGRIAGPDGGWDYASFDPAHRRLYVAHGEAITAIDVDSGAVTPKLMAVKRAHIALPLPGGDEILVTDGGADTAFIADARTGAVRVSVKTGKNPDAALVDPASKLALVMNGRSGDITLIDTAAGKAVGTIPVGGTLEFGVADGAGKVFVNIEDKGEIAVVDTRARKVVGHWPMAGCEEPSGLALAKDEKLLIAACANGRAEAVSAVTGKVVATLAIGPEPDAAFFDPKRKLAYIPSGGDGTLSEIAVRGPADVAVVGKVATRPGARTGAVDPETGKVYLPSADVPPRAEGAPRPAPVPGSFAVLVLGR